MMELQNDLFQSIKNIILQAREKVFRLANSSLLESYWVIGRIIVEDEQKGKAKAEYGKATLKNLSLQLTAEFGKGFDESNLRNMRAFYQAFPICDTLRHELSWSHYRQLSRLDSKQKRQYYLNEAVASGWNSRELQRQINTLVFERVVKYLPESKTNTIQNLMKDPYIFEFLGLPQDTKNAERTIETQIINHLQTFLLEFGKGFAFVARQQHIVSIATNFVIFYTT